MVVEVNKPVADFECAGTGGSFSLKQALNDGGLVIYFYPKDNTPGCTTEGENFRDLMGEFNAAGFTVVGVSRDTLKSHEGFKSKMAFNFELLSDPNETLCTQFDVMKMKNMYGKQVRGVERSTFIINKKGVLLQEWRGVKVLGHVQAVLDFAKANAQ